MSIGLFEHRTVSVAVAVGTSSMRPERTTGEAVAALMAAMIGMLALAAVNQVTAISPGLDTWVHSVGRLWMPGAESIGPYSGKETLSALAWLASWAVLHPALRTRDLPLSRWLIVFLVGVSLATTFIWPPVFEYVAGVAR